MRRLLTNKIKTHHNLNITLSPEDINTYRYVCIAVLSSTLPRYTYTSRLYKTSTTKCIVLKYALLFIVPTLVMCKDVVLVNLGFLNTWHYLSCGGDTDTINLKT